MTVQILTGDCRDLMRAMPEKSVQCVVTSPPYFGLRDYGVDGQIGLEPTPDEFVAAMIEVFREVRRVLKDDGTLWLNLGDSYAGSWGNYGGANRGNGAQRAIVNGSVVKDQTKRNGLYLPPTANVKGLKPKDLIGIPWRVAFALQADGWYLRQDIIWAKANPMPESVRDRCTKAHEYIFLMSKSERYFYDSKAIAEPRHAPGNKSHKGTTAYEEGDDRHRTKAGLIAYAERQRALVSEDRKALRSDIESRHRSSIPGGQSMQAEPDGTRNKRSVWSIATAPFSEAHFATFPPELPEICIKAGSREGDTILDPFGGAGTTGLVADRLGRNAILTELNPEYAAMARRRIKGDAPMLAQVTA